VSPLEKLVALAAALGAGVLLAVVVAADDDTSVADPPAVTTEGATSVTGTDGATTSAGAKGGGRSTVVSPGTTVAATTEATTGATTEATTGATTEATVRTTPGTTTATTAGPAPPPPPYQLAPTRRCLRAAGFVVTAVRSTDPRLRALGDLAQRTSLELRVNRRTLGLAFGDTRLLLSLMRVPDDPHRLEARRNALLMYLPSARAEAAIVRDCLRP